MKIDVQNVFLVVGLVQGIVIICFCMSKGTAPAKYFLSGIIAILCIALINNLRFFFVYESSTILITNYLIWEPVTLIGPFLFFYCKSLFERKFVLRKVDYLHFAPVILELFPTILALYLWLFIENPSLSFINIYDDFSVIPQVFSVTVYLLLSWRYLLKNKSISDLKTYRWVRDLLIGVSLIDLIWIPFISLYLTKQIWLLDFLFFYPIFYPVVIFLFFIGVRVMTSNLSFRANPYSSQEIKEYLSTIESVLLKEKLYAKADLNLNELSERVSINAKTLSFVLNHSIHKSFNEFINEYRIKDALSKIESGEADRTTLEGIAFQVGFSSRSTFYRAFKQVVGKPPADFIDK